MLYLEIYQDSESELQLPPEWYVNSKDSESWTRIDYQDFKAIPYPLKEISPLTKNENGHLIDKNGNIYQLTFY